MGGEDSGADKRWKPPPSPSQPPPPEKTDLKLWGILAFTVIGATATTFAVHQLRRTFDWVYTQVASRKGFTGKGSSFRSSFQEEAWRRYNKRMQEEYEEELERVERIRRMQSVFNRERNKFRRGFENWKENEDQQYHQQFQRHDWYWKTNQRRTNNHYKDSPPPPNQESSRVYPLSHHYSVLGLNRSRAAPYTEAEIKKAFRVKAMEFHPDQNQDNKDVAEAKFKEVLFSYEAIKKERKDTDG